MDNFKNLIFKSLFPLIVLLLIIAACNYITVNNHIKDFYKTELDTVPRTHLDCLIDSSKMVSSNQPIDKSIINERNCVSSNSSKDLYYNKMIQFEKMKSYLFDSNTITFMVTLIIVLLISFVINSQKEIQKGLDDIKRGQKRLNITEHYHAIYVNVMSIYLESQNFKKIVSTNNQILSEDSWEVVYRMYRKTRTIQSTIQKKKLYTISSYYKNEIVVVIKDTIDTIDFPDNIRYGKSFSGTGNSQ